MTDYETRELTQDEIDALQEALLDAKVAFNSAQRTWERRVVSKVYAFVLRGQAISGKPGGFQDELSQHLRFGEVTQRRSSDVAGTYEPVFTVVINHREGPLVWRRHSTLTVPVSWVLNPEAGLATLRTLVDAQRAEAARRAEEHEREVDELRKLADKLGFTVAPKETP